MSFHLTTRDAESIDDMLGKFISVMFHAKYRRITSLVLLCYLSLYMYILLKNNMTILAVPITVLMAVFLVTLTDCRITIEVVREQSPDLPVEVPADEDDDESKEQNDEDTEEESKESEGSDQPGFPAEEQPVAEHSAAEQPVAEQAAEEQNAEEPRATEWTSERLAEMD